MRNTLSTQHYFEERFQREYLSPKALKRSVSSGDNRQVLVPTLQTRKRLGIFYTNEIYAELLAQLAIGDANARVIDLACGDGVLLVAAYRTKEKLLRSNGIRLTERVRSKFLHDLIGVDIMSSAARSAAVHLLFEASLKSEGQPCIGICNSVELRPGKALPIFYGSLATKSLNAVLLEPVDVVLINPPFTRQERIAPQLKSMLPKLFKNYQEYLNGRLGFYAFFVFLADMFAKKGGRIGLILPASVLRLQSTEGIRKFLLDHYEIELILTSSACSAFSESSMFREIIMIARKFRNVGESIPASSSTVKPCVLVTLKRIPKTFREVNHLASEMKLLPCGSHRMYNSHSMTVRKVSQEELRKNMKNLFLLVSVGDFRTINLWKKIEKQGSRKLVKLKQYLKESEGDIHRGVETRTHVGISLQSMFILRDSFRAKGLGDNWIVTRHDGTNIFCHNRRTGGTLRVPPSALMYGLRRFSGLSTMDISGVLDFIVVRSFRGIEAFLGTNGKEKIAAKLPLWKKHVENRLTNFLIARRLGLSRPGTRLLAYFSSVYAAPAGVLWSIKGIPDDDVKILTLWFNSSINLLQLLLNRVETCGPWMELHEYVLNDLSILNPRALSATQRTRILATFDKVKKQTFPSIYDQISSGFWAREEIDRAILLVLGFGPKETKNLCKVIRHALAGELANLMRLERKKL